VALFVVIGFPHTSDCDQKSKAKIISGVWSRHVPWHQRSKWRTDIFKAVLAEPRLTVCRLS